MSEAESQSEAVEADTRGDTGHQSAAPMAARVVLIIVGVVFIVSAGAKLAAIDVFERQISAQGLASLNGAAWLAFLDQTLGGSEFSRGIGQWLPRIAYDPGSSLVRISPEEMDQLVALAVRWIRRHRTALAAGDTGKTIL